jgi:hypothetical protein
MSTCSIILTSRFQFQVSFVRHEVSCHVEMNSLVRQTVAHADRVTVTSDWNIILFVIRQLVNVIVR